MSNLKKDLQNVLIPEAIIAIKPMNQAGTIHCIDIKEDKPSATLKHLRVTHIKESDICLSFDVSGDDKYTSYSPYFRKPKDSSFNRRCDFFIARKDGGIWRLYFGDMKSEKLKVPKIVQQLSSSQLFFEYVTKIIKHEYENDELLEIDPVIRYVCVHDDATMKPMTNPKNNNDPYPIQCKKSKKNLVVVPVGITSKGQAKISFNKFCSE